MRQTRWLSLGLLLGCGTLPAYAQLPVTDAAVTLQTTITSLQMILSVGNQILELTGLDEIVVGDDFQADMDSLGEVVSAARDLSYDVASLQIQLTTLFQLSTVPRSASELQIRLRTIRQVVYDNYVYALRTQTLLTTAERTVQHLKRLIASVGDLIGNEQSNQTLIQVEHTMSATLEKMHVQTASYNHAQALERLSEAMTLESITQINIELMADYP